MYRFFFGFVMLWAVCVQAMVPARHDVRITELMANSAIGIDWVEITNTAQKEVDLKGCKLRVGLGKVKEKVFPRLPMAPGRHIVIATSAFPVECAIPVDLVWSGVSMRSSMPEAVDLWCPGGRSGEVVDRVLFNLHVAKAAKGRSIDYCGSAIQHPGLMDGWGPTQDPAFCSILGADDFGSPGRPGTCPALKEKTGLQAGDVEITEVMVHPVSGTPEWVELTNITQKMQNLDGCCLRIGAGKEWHDLLLGSIRLAPAASTVLASSPGVMGPNGTNKSVILKGLRLVDTKPQQLILACGKTVICQADYDPTLGEVQMGHSICFDYETDPAKPSAKFAASNLSPYFSSPKGVNYGTPFDPAPCDKHSVLQSEDTQSKGCSVSFSPGTGHAGLLIFLIFFVLLLFRKWTRTSRQ